MKKVLALALTLMLLVSLTACGGKTSTSQQEPPAANAPQTSEDAQTEPAGAAEPARTKMEISVGCGTSSGVGYVTASTVGALMQTQFPEYYTCKPEVTTGGAESLRLLAAGDVVLSSAMSDDVVAAYNGDRGFEGLTGTLRYITSGNMTTIQCFAKSKLDVETLADCVGLRVAVTSGTMFKYYWPYLLETYGLTNEDFKSVESYATKDAVEAFKNNQIDLICMVTAVPNNTIQDMAMSDAVRLLTMSEEARDKIIELQPCFQKTTVPAGTYTTWDKDIQTIGVRNIYVCTEDTDYQMVYDWVKTIDENNDALRSAHPQAGEYGIRDNVLPCQLIPFHQAAEDYYKEAGLIK